MFPAPQGMPLLRERLLEKVREENDLRNVDVMVTAGANQVRGTTAADETSTLTTTAIRRNL